MAYEIDFISVDSNKASKDADAICIRWKKDVYDSEKYIIGVIDGGYEAHGEAMVSHLNQYYFDDRLNKRDSADKAIDFIVVTHPDEDHTIGIKSIIKNFKVKKLYMNCPWYYIDELWDTNSVNDERITKKSLEIRLREKYKHISEIEELAKKNNINIKPVFQGTNIEDVLCVLSPSKQFYLDLIVESEKTPLQENNSLYHDGVFSRIINAAKKITLKIFESWDIETLREEVSTSAENESSVVIRGIIDGSGFLLSGDAGIRALNNALDYMELLGENPIKDISFYQIPHHGSRHNISPSLLNRMVGKKVKDGTIGKKMAYASVAENSDHPLKMVTNAYIRRGVKVYKTNGNSLRYHIGDMPDRNWSAVKQEEFSNYVEEWDE